MPTRSVTIDGATWNVYPSGFVTQYDQDEFALIFISGSGAARDTRVTRYSPQGVRSREASLAEMSETRLVELFRASQPGSTSPEAGYSR
jgi:hypothetical protein